jgi:diguanylate cyclase (GGDEF)-like protein
LPEAPLSPNEDDRLAALRGYDLLAGARDESLDALCRVVASIFNTQIALVSISDTNRQVIKGSVGFGADELARDLAPCAYAIQGESPMVVEDLSLDPRFADNPLVGEPHNLRFYVGAPLLTPDRMALGTLCAIDTRTHQPTPDQLAALTDLSHVVMALFNMRKAMSWTRNLALTDSLTGVANRAGLIMELEALIERRKYRESPFALIYLDIDNFKHINDTRGHTTGDEVLARIGATLRSCVRSVDLAGRLGGDEFAVLVPDCDENEAKRVANRIFSALGTIATRQHDPIHVSVGAASFPTPPANVNEALGIADRLMYAAKHAGKNRVVTGSIAELGISA